MTFDKISIDIKCDCLSGAHIDTENEYVRKLKKDVLDEKDFLTHWERGLHHDNTECEEICSYKGISINMINPEFEEQILTKYKTTFSFNPKKGAYILKFKLKDGAGKVKFAPLEDDQSHYNLFKADNFSLLSLEVIDTVKFA